MQESLSKLTYAVRPTRFSICLTGAIQKLIQHSVSLLMRLVGRVLRRPRLSLLHRIEVSGSLQFGLTVYPFILLRFSSRHELCLLAGSLANEDFSRSFFE